MPHATPLYKSSLLMRCAIAAGAFSAIILLRLTVLHDITAHYPLSLFIIPVVLSAWYSGTVLAVAMLVLSILSAAVFSPQLMDLTTAAAWIRICLFMSGTVVCIFVTARMHRERHKAEHELNKREKIETDLYRQIAHRKAVEEQLALALQKAEHASHAKTDFLSNMSHEIRTPLNAVVGLTRILAMSNPLTPKQKEFISTLQLSADALLTLITDVLDVSKIEAGAIELESAPFNLHHICEDVVTIMSQKAQEKNLHVILEADASLPSAYIGDAQRIKQVILNLCGNAIKFTDAGIITIQLSATRVTAEMDSVTINVTDTGIGIPADRLPKIFDQFVQGDAAIHKNYGGTGLGLTISKKLIETMGGDISVESQHAAGSTFKIRLPLRKATSVASRAQHTEITGDLTGPSHKGDILIVEDNEANILVLKSYMDGLGYSYDIALSGADALKRIEDKRYWLVLMDIRMPGLDGIETTRMIRRNEQRLRRGHLHIIGVTANALESDRKKCFEAGMDNYMTKPYDPVLLESMLRGLSVNVVPVLSKAQSV